MALVICPECGKENVSSTASACPNCGFDIKGYYQKIEEDKASEEASKKARENLEMMKAREAERHTSALKDIPDPKPYGNVYAYLVFVLIGIILAFSAGPAWICIGAVGCVAYWYQASQDYKKFLEDPDAYKEEKASRKGMEIDKGVDISGPSLVNEEGRAFCPNCGSEDISRQVFQENKGSKTFTTTKSKYREKGHGCLWWLLIGWWWWIVDLYLWVVFFIPRLIIALIMKGFKKKKYKGNSVSVSNTVNDISYRTICTCNKCGHTWG